jgi:sugar phosphate isomerase/epimerase
MQGANSWRRKHHWLQETVMKISIMSYSFHGLYGQGMQDIFGFLETCKYRYGVEAVDIWNGTLDRRTDEEFIRKIRQALDERELVVASYAVDRAYVWDNEPDIRNENYKRATESLAAAEILGAKTVRIDMSTGDPAMPPEQFDLIVKRFKEWSRRAGDNGYQIGPETHFGPALVPENMVKLHRAVDHPAFGFLLHIGHWVEGREEAGDKLLAPWTMHTHVDARITRSCLEEKMRLLLAAGYAGYWGVEHHSGANEYAEVECQLAEVRRTLKKVQTDRAVPTK